MKPQNVRDIIQFCRFHHKAFEFPNKTHWIIYPCVNTGSAAVHSQLTMLQHASRHLNGSEQINVQGPEGRGDGNSTHSPFQTLSSDKHIDPADMACVWGPTGSDPASGLPNTTSSWCCSSAAREQEANIGWPGSRLAFTTPSPRPVVIQFEPRASP